MRTPSSRRPETCRRRSLGDAGAARRGRQRAAANRRSLGLLHPLSNGRAASPRLPSPARRRRGNDPSRRRCAGRGQSLLQPRSRAHSPDHAKLAWAADDLGSELHDHSRPRPRARARTSTTASSTPAATSSGRATSTGFLYVEQDDNHRPFRVMLHRLGTDQGDDVEVFAEPDPAWFIGVSGSLNGRTAMIDIHGHDGSETRVVDLARSRGCRRASSRRAGPGISTTCSTTATVFLSAPTRRRATSRSSRRRASPGEANWRDVVPHRDGCYLIDAVLLADWLVLLAREDSRPRLIVVDLNTGARHDVAFDEETYALDFETIYEFDSPRIRFAYSSMARPEEIFDYDCATRERSWSSGRSSRRVSTRRAMSRGSCSRPPRTARPCRCRF